MRLARWILLLAAGLPAAGQASQADPPAFSVEVDVRPTAPWADAEFEAVVALRDPRNGSRLGSVELLLDAGQSRRSSQELPGGLGALHVEIELDGARAVSYVVEIQRDGRVLSAHRARVQLSR